MVTPENLTEGSISWASLSKTIVDSQASSWFEQYGPVPVKDTLAPGAFDADPNIHNVWSTTFPDLDGEDSRLSIPGLVIDLEELGDEIDLTEGVLGPALIQALSNAGVSWWYNTMIPLSHFESVDLPELRSEGVALWNTYFETPVEQRFKVFRNTKGEETCLWFAHMLAATRPVEHIATRQFLDTESDVRFQVEVEQEHLNNGALTFGQWSTRAVIPQLAKDLFYLAETPFPSNYMMTMGRSVAFGDELDQRKYPRPVIIHKHQSFARGAFDSSDQGHLMTGTLMPHVVEMGWTFSTTSPREIENIVSVISEGLIRIATILEDGYLNYKTGDYPFLFDSSLLSPSCFDPDVEHGTWELGLPYWVPVTRLGFLLEESNNRAISANRDKNLQDMYWVSENGAGANVPMVINTFVFRKLIPSKEWFMIDRLLDASVRMDVLNESTNSLSNWGIAKYKQGLLDEAIEKFELALGRPDNFAEAEASFYLSQIWQEKGDLEKSKIFLNRCSAAGGYQPSAFIKEDDSAPAENSSGSGLSKSSSRGLGNGALPIDSKQPEPVSRSSFCGNCGVMFQSISGKFCQNCGSVR
jgi:hypothetical protein